MLLLHLMSLLCPNQIRAIYIDHQLQSMSADWGSFVLDQCQQLNIPCTVQKVTVAEGNLESQARSVRYQAFAQHLQKNEILILAHHQQDQAETLMLRLLSGAGIQGLAAMKNFDERQGIQIWRPLLEISHEHICQWAAQLHVQNIQDPSNDDLHYDRNWARHDLWPVLTQRFPKMQQALCRTAEIMQDADEILTEVLQQDLNACGTASELDLTQFSQLSLARQRQLLSSWMKGGDQYRPAFNMVTRLITEVIQAKTDAQAALHWNQWVYVRYQNKLYRLTKQIFDAAKTDSPILLKQKISAHQHFSVLSGQYAVQNMMIGLSPELLDREFDLQLRQGGEKIHLYGRMGSWPLKKAIQDAQIFPWLRHTIQILSIDNVMLGVFTPKGFWLAQSKYCVQDGWQPKLIDND